MKKRNLETVIPGSHTPDESDLFVPVMFWTSGSGRNSQSGQAADVQGAEMIMYHKRDGRYEELIEIPRRWSATNAST
jgi:hypothetical protein